jgi:putative ATP-binding cassette transporter
LLYIGWLSPLVLACALGFATVAIGAYFVLEARAIRLLLAARTDQGALVDHYRTLIHGFRELRQHRPRRLGFLTDVLTPAATTVRRRTVAGQSLFAIVVSWGQLAYFAFLGIVLFALPGPAGFDHETLTGLVVVLLFLISPLNMVVSLLPGIGAARASLRKIRAVLPALADLDSDPAPACSLPLRDSIRLESVGFTYRSPTSQDDGADGEPFTLGPIDLTLQPGELVFLGGGNGTGKTTLVKLVTGLYEPDVGTIHLDGRAIGPDDREAYRQLFSVVFADGHLFRDLVGLDSDGLENRAQEGLERLALARKVRLNGRAYSTLDLSQGQRGRLALLTSLLEDRPVYVFDEWAANQDPRFKRFFYAELLADLKERGKAVLVISHDEAYYDVADRVVRLRDGLIHDEQPVIVENDGR